MSDVIRAHLKETFPGISTTNLIRKARTFDSPQLYFELEGFIRYYYEKYNDLDKATEKVISILDNHDNAKDVIFYGKGKNRDKIELINKEKNIYDQKEESGEGLFACKRCKKRKIFYKVDYRRSADEPPIITFRCENPECGYTWVEG